MGGISSNGQTVQIELVGDRTSDCAKVNSHNWTEAPEAIFLEDKILKIMKIAKEPISMETPIGDDDDSHLGDFLEDTMTVAPSEAVQNTSLSDTVRQVLDSLSPREAKVLRMRFGIEMPSDHTLEEVGKQFDVTRERIRQIETKALRKLRHPSRADKLRSFVENTEKEE